MKGDFAEGPENIVRIEKWAASDEDVSAVRSRVDRLEGIVDGIRHSQTVQGWAITLFAGAIVAAGIAVVATIWTSIGGLRTTVEGYRQEAAQRLDRWPTDLAVILNALKPSPAPPAPQSLPAPSAPPPPPVTR